MNQMAAENRRNSEAESAYVRKNVWDSNETTPASDADMGNTILGDVQYPAPVVVASPPAQQSSLPMIALLLASLLPTGAAAGLAGYLLARQQPSPVIAEPSPYEDESISIRLGRLDDIVDENK